MKKTILSIMAIVIIAVCFAQKNDSTKFNFDYVIELDKKVNNIQLNLEKCHTEFKDGLICAGLGVGLSAIGTFCVMNYTKRLNNPNYVYNQPNDAMLDLGGVSLAVGGTLIMIGGVIQIDSHKWIGRAGKK